MELQIAEVIHLNIYLLGLLILILALIIIASQMKNSKINRFMASVPGPVSFPLIGSAFHLINLDSTNLPDFLRKQLRQYPRIAGYWAAGKAYVYTGDRKILNTIFCSIQNTHKPTHYALFHDLGDGIFSSNGAEWRQTRKQINPSFRTEILQTFSDSFSYHTKVFLDNLQQNANTGSCVDLFTHLHTCTFDLVFENMLGYRMDLQRKNLTYLSKDFTEAAKMTFDRLFNPLFWSPWTYYISGKQNKLDRVAPSLRNATKNIIDIHMERRSKNEKNSDLGNSSRFMDILLNNIETKHMSVGKAAEEAADLSIGGSITTSMTVAWALKIMAIRPEIQNKAYQEVMEVSEGKEIMMHDLSKLSYLESVVKETLRHYTVPMVGRDIVEDIQLDGQSYAMQSMKCLLANALLRYKFSSDETLPEDVMDGDYSLLYMLFPKSGFHVRVENRSASKTRTEDQDCSILEMKSLPHFTRKHLESSQPHFETIFENDALRLRSV
nr:PREDICTED: cytochrome P450 4d2-like isoform X2 [Bemisia tabaci]